MSEKHQQSGRTVNRRFCTVLLGGSPAVVLTVVSRLSVCCRRPPAEVRRRHPQGRRRPPARIAGPRRPAGPLGAGARHPRVRVGPPERDHDAAAAGGRGGVEAGAPPPAPLYLSVPRALCARRGPQQAPIGGSYEKADSGPLSVRPSVLRLSFPAGEGCVFCREAGDFGAVQGAGAGGGGGPRGAAACALRFQPQAGSLQPFSHRSAGHETILTMATDRHRCSRCQVSRKES